MSVMESKTINVARLGRDYSSVISAQVSPEEAIDKISRVQEWWANDFSGSAKGLGDTFTVRFKETFVDFRVSKVVPNAEVVWDVVDCHLPWLENQKEWNGTRIVWHLQSEGGVTSVTMTHEGLVPESECFENCQAGWNFYTTKSLQQFLTNGVGLPDRGACSDNK